MLLSLRPLLIAMVWSLGTSIFAANPGDNVPVLGTEALYSVAALSGGDSMRVLWRISKYKLGKTPVWGEEEARRLLFKPLDMDATKITFDSRTCRDIVFRKKMVDVKEYLAHTYQTTPLDLGIKEDVIEAVTTNCDLPGFSEYMRLKDGWLIIHLKGVFFYFDPAINY